MNSSESARPPITASDLLSRPEYAEVARAVKQRKEMVTAMTRHARFCGLNAEETLVNRHYDKFYRWHMGILSTGYLIKQTGVKYDPSKNLKNQVR